MKLGVAGGREAGGVDGAAFEEEAGDGGGSCGGELPVAGELRGVDGHVVGVAFDAERPRRQGGGENGEHGDGRAANLGRTGGEEAGFVEGDDEAVGGDEYGHAAGRKAAGGDL